MKRWYIDWYLPEYDIYFEHFGVENKKNIKKREEKIEYFKGKGMTLIYTSKTDTYDIETIIRRKLIEKGIKL